MSRFSRFMAVIPSLMLLLSCRTRPETGSPSAKTPTSGAGTGGASDWVKTCGSYPAVSRYWLSYVRPKSRVWDLHVVDPGQGKQRRLTTGLRILGRRSWRHDGAFVVFVDHSSDNHVYHLVVMDVAGRKPRNLTSVDERASAPAWSPNGKLIAYVSDRAGSWDIYVSGSDGAEHRRLSRDAGHDHRPEWSPDGTQLVFTRTYGGYNRRTGACIYQRSAIGVVRVDGSGERPLTRLQGTNENPKWSPDGTRIAYRSNADGDYEICVVDADGSDPKQLTRNDSDDVLLRWTLDGHAIVFASADRQVCSVGVEGGKVVPLGGVARGSLSLDGKAVAYTSAKPPGIFVADAEGAAPVRVTVHHASGLTWFPAPQRTDGSEASGSGWKAGSDGVP